MIKLANFRAADIGTLLVKRCMTDLDYLYDLESWSASSGRISPFLSAFCINGLQKQAVHRFYRDESGLEGLLSGITLTHLVVTKENRQATFSFSYIWA